MPIFHVQYQGKGQAPDGTSTDLQPSLVLGQRGPVIQVTVTVHQTISEQLLQQGKQLPAPLPGLALIDTGAISTCIDEDAAKQLGLPVVDVVQMASASHAAVPANVYPAHAEIIGAGIGIDIPRAIAAALAPQGLLLLIGRDMLQHCTLHYNGLAGEITLSL